MRIGAFVFVAFSEAGEPHEAMTNAIATASANVLLHLRELRGMVIIASPLAAIDCGLWCNPVIKHTFCQ